MPCKEVSAASTVIKRSGKGAAGETYISEDDIGAERGLRQRKRGVLGVSGTGKDGERSLRRKSRSDGEHSQNDRKAHDIVRNSGACRGRQPIKKVTIESSGADSSHKPKARNDKPKAA